MVDTARVHLWGTSVGAVTWVAERHLAVFQFDPDFTPSGIQIAPLTMPLRGAPFEFPALSRDTFHGLPGLLADSLPDRFGNALINTWLAAQGRSADSFHPVERLCYTGARGMGALEFEPDTRRRGRRDDTLDVAGLVSLVNTVLDERAGLRGRLDGSTLDAEVLEDILRVGTSAGGARAKAVLAWNPATGEFRSGQLDLPPGFQPWLLKFDGIAASGDHGLADPQGYGRIEYAYYLMATVAGIQMAPCRLHHENDRSHFMTRRFDRTEDGDKLHMQSLGAMAHYDYNRPEDYSYEQALQVMRRLRLPPEDIEQQVLRALFNVVTRNQDDHVKNIAFLMDRRGQWRLAPAFDVSFNYRSDGAWTARHQMSVNGRRDNFTRDDLLAFGIAAGLKRPAIARLLERARSAATRWAEFADEAGVDPRTATTIGTLHRAL